MATAGSIVIDLLARTGSFETDMQRASRRIKSTTMDFDKAEAAARKFALAAGAAAMAFASSTAAIVISAAKAMDATSKMAQQVGVTTEALTGMRFAAQQFANVTDQQFDQAMRRMTRRIEEAAAGSGAAKKALEEMGLSAQELSRLTPDKQMLALADAMKRTESQANRLRYTMAIFDTEGMALVPALQQGAAAFEENIKLAERYGVVLSTEAAQAAEEFTTNLSHLGSMLDGLKIQLASEVLPTLNSFISNVITASTEVDGLHTEVRGLAGDSAFKEWFDASLVGLARVADVAVFLAKSVKLVGNAFRAVAADADVAVAALNKAQIWNWFSDDASSQLEGALARRNEIVGKFNQDLVDLGQYQGNKYEQAALRAVNTHRVVSESVKLVDLTTQSATQAMDNNSAAGKRNASAITDAQRAAEAFRKEQERSLKAQVQSISALHQQAQALEDQVAVFGRGKHALDQLAIARLEEQAAMLRGFEGSEEAVRLLELEIEARERLMAAGTSLEGLEEQARARDEYLREWERTNEQIGQTLTDALMRGFEDGKSFGKNFADTLKNMFRTLVLRPIIEPIMQNVAGGIQNAFGMGQQQQSGGGMPNFNMTMGGGIGNALASFGSTIGSSMVSQFGAGLTAGAGGALSTAGAQTIMDIGVGGSSSFSAGSSIGGAGVGSIMGYASALYDLTQGNYGSAVGTAIGTAILPGIGTAIGGFLGSMVDGIFGHTPKTRHGRSTVYELTDDNDIYRKHDEIRQEDAYYSSMEQMTQAAIDGITSTFDLLGVNATLGNFWSRTDIATNPNNDEGHGVSSGGAVMVGGKWVDIGIPHSSDDTKFGVGGWSDEPVLPRLAVDLQLTMLEAFQAASEQLPSILANMLEGADIRGMDIEAAQALAAAFDAVIQQVGLLQSAVERLPFESLRDLSFDAAANLIHFAGGLEALDAGMTSYFQNFYSEAEQLEWQTQQLSGAFESLGLEMPDVTAGADVAKSAYRELVEAQDLTAESGQQAYAMLMTLSGGFAELVTGMDELNAASKDLADQAIADAQARAAAIMSERLGLENQLLQLQGDTVELRRRELGALDESNRALQQQIWALRDAAAAQQAYERSIQSVMSSLSGIRETVLLDQMGGDDERYGYFKKQADDLARLIPQLTDQDAITQAMAQLNTLTTRAYGTLDKDQKVEMGGEFLTFIDRTEGMALKQLESINQQNREESKRQAQEIAKATSDAVGAQVGRIADAIIRASEDMPRETANAIRGAVAQAIGQSSSQYTEVYSGAEVNA